MECEMQSLITFSFRLRNDVGALWENFIISERKSYVEYHNIFSNTYFGGTDLSLRLIILNLGIRNLMRLR